ncbi:response regulator, partial [Streptomyces sp. SID724]|nr:response regulator [Streptomyces sp. SID724]
MPRVVLVEDDPSVRDGVEMGLRRRGHEVLATATGEDGLAALDAFRPDLLLLDLMLPLMDGVEVCRRVRADSQLPIIMLTARGDDMDIVVGLEAGADDYVVKPARTEVIEARIRAVLRRIEAPAGVRPAVEHHGDLDI